MDSGLSPAVRQAGTSRMPCPPGNINYFICMPVRDRQQYMEIPKRGYRVNPCANISIDFPDCTSPEMETMPPFPDPHTQKISPKICTGTCSLPFSPPAPPKKQPPGPFNPPQNIPHKYQKNPMFSHSHHG